MEVTKKTINELENKFFKQENFIGKTSSLKVSEIFKNINGVKLSNKGFSLIIGKDFCAKTQANGGALLVYKM